MARGQITDQDLIDSNIQNGVEIFGVTGTYSNNILDGGLYYLGAPAMSWDLGSGGYTMPRGDLRFYDDGTKIIIMGCSIHEGNGASFSQFGGAYYYAEILKSTGVITIYPEYVTSLGTSIPYGNYKLVYTGGYYQYTGAPDDSSTGFVYFNGTAVVPSASKAAILSASNIGSFSISYRGRTLQKSTLFEMGDTTFYGAGGACLQTLQYG